jgi:hypothetical protein
MTQTQFNFTPTTRAGGRSTSRKAAGAARFSARTTAFKVLSVLGDGIARTDEEIYREMGVDPYVSTPRARRADMVGMGLIEAQDEKGQSGSGCAATRWAITGRGLDTLDELNNSKEGAA